MESAFRRTKLHQLTPPDHVKLKQLSREKARRKKRGPSSSDSRSVLSTDQSTDKDNPQKVTTFASMTEMMDEGAVKLEARTELSLMKNLYFPLLRKEDNLVEHIQCFLQNADLASQRKKELQHKKWSNRVFEPIQRKVRQAVHGPAFVDRDRRQRELYRQYLEHTNRRGHVFLDTMDKGEQYAQALNARCPVHAVCKRPLRDPLLMPELQRKREERTILRYTTIGQGCSLCNMDSIERKREKTCLHFPRKQVNSLRDNDIDNRNLPPLPQVPVSRTSDKCLRWLQKTPGNNVSTSDKVGR